MIERYGECSNFLKLSTVEKHIANSDGISAFEAYRGILLGICLSGSFIGSIPRGELMSGWLLTVINFKNLSIHCIFITPHILFFLHIHTYNKA